MFEQVKAFINPTINPDLTKAHALQRQHLPTLWLLGKTGAGKSSLIQAITGLNSVEIGNGFKPCTMTAQTYKYPQDKPVMQFLDTRGLSEAGYDASHDLQQMAGSTSAVVVVMKVDDLEQSAVLMALKQVKKQQKCKHLLVIHSAALSCPENELRRQVTFKEKQISEVWGTDFSAVCVDFECENDVAYRYSSLHLALSKILPVVDLIVAKAEHHSLENKNFEHVKKEVLWYAGSASASDLIPAVGLVSVPAIQAKMLHSLANQYGVEWHTRSYSELIATLGSGFALQYSLKLGGRQLMKLLPVYGQTIGTVAAAAMSFASTYGLGRSAAYYLYHKRKEEPVSKAAMRAMYQQAFQQARAISHHEKD